VRILFCELGAGILTASSIELPSELDPSGHEVIGGASINIVPT
jgi:hypothetical protein